MNTQTNSRHEGPAALVVDDSAVARRVLGALLARLGFRIDTASSAEAGLARLEEKTPDVVFMDHLLPGMDGLSAVRHIRENPISQRLPIVMYTSLETRQFALAARKAGANDVLFKSGGGAGLEIILARLGLAPDCEPVEDQLPANVPAALGAALRRYKEEMREELLAEFAIMERHEEAMRKQLFSRMDSMTRQTVRAIEDQFRERRIEQALTAQSRRRTSWAVAACLAVMFGASAWANLSLWQQVRALGGAGAPAVSAPVADDRGRIQADRVTRSEATPVLTAAVTTNWAAAQPRAD